MVDVTEILEHWYAGRPKVEVARSLGVDVKTVRRYVAPAEAAGMGPGGPPVSEEQWRALARGWFPQIAGTGVRQVSWREIALHHDRIAALVGVVPVSVIHQRLAAEQGLEASVASLRRYVRAHFPDGPRQQEVRMIRPPVPPGAEAQVDYGYMGLWPDPSTGRRRRLWAFSMVLPYSRHLFIRPAVSMTQRAWTEAHVAAFEFFGGAPRRSWCRTTSRPGCASRTCTTRRSTAAMPSWPGITGCWSTRPAPTIPGTRPSSRRTSGISAPASSPAAAGRHWRR